MTDFGFQNDGIEWLKGRVRAMLGDDPGLGKTRQLLLAAEGPVLVVAPAIARSVWRDEHAKWTPDLDVTFCAYSYLCERGDKGKVFPRARPQYRSRKWGTVIFDEAHNLKNRQTNWAKAAMQLKADRIFLATGTPIVNWAHELWTLLKILHPGDKAFSSYWRWVETWFDVWLAPWGAREIQGLQVRWTWDDFHEQNLGGVFLQRRREDVLKDLPPLTESYIEVTMEGKQAKVYKELKEDYLAWIADNEALAVFNTAAQTTKLQKISTGLEVETGGRVAGSAKLEAFAQELDNRRPPMVVFCWFKETIKQVARICEDKGLSYEIVTGDVSQNDRAKRIDLFKEGHADVLIGTLGTISESVTLTVADTCLVLERSWRPSTNEQAIRRLHRIGQDRPVTVIHFVTTDSIDAGQLRTTRAKTDQQVKALRHRDLRDLV